jgi:ferrochelatase
VPELHFIGGYHQSPSYIGAICASIRHHIKEQGQPDKLIFSYHGTPERYLKNGDPYHCFCHQTTRLVRESLNLPEDKVMTTFQSRFGREPWLQPYTDKTLERLPADGIKKVALICPGFSSDCLETIEEIDAEGREIFMDAGGEAFHYIPCLNSDSAHIEALADVVNRQLG